MVTIEVGGQPLTLLPEKAAFLGRSQTLLVADAHIGKAVSFRKLGVPVPRFLVPKVETREFEKAGRYHFEVEARLPWFGRLVCYAGWLEPAARP